MATPALRMGDSLAAAAQQALSISSQAPPDENALLPELPMNIILHILELLPAGARAWSARRAFKAAHEKFKRDTNVMLDRPELPLPALKEAMSHAQTQAKQWQLAAARADCGDLAGLKWLHSQGCVMDCRVCSSAAAGGHLHILQWARSLQPPVHWNSSVCSAAAANNHLEVLQWARSQVPPCPWNSDVCRFAAGHGHLEILQWARAQDPPCPWTAWVCSDAAAKGQPHILKWLRTQDPPCPWNKRECEELAMRGKGLISLLRSLPE